MTESKTLNLIFQAVSDESRRKILDILRASGELKVGDIANAFSMSLNGVSKHLKVLENAGLISRRVEGRVHYIALDRTGFKNGYQWFHDAYNVWNHQLKHLKDLLEDNKGEKS